MSDSLSSVLILDKMKFKENDSSSSSMLGMIFFTIMLSITNYLSRQFTYFMDDVDLKKIINFELILHNFYKKNSVQYEGKMSHTNSLYMGNVVQTCIFSDRFKALWEHIIKNTNESIHSLKEYTMDNKSDDAVYMVNQKDKFLISSEHEIYAYTYTAEDNLNESKDSKMSSKTLTIVIELYSFKSSVDTMKTLVEKITHSYLSNEQQAVTQQRDTTHAPHTGGAGFKTPSARNYDSELSYQPASLKADTIKGRFGNSNTNVFNNSVNYQGKPKDIDMINNRDAVPRLPYSTHGVATIGEYQQRGQTNNSNINMERNTPDLYNVLQQNPYAIKRTYK